MRAREDRNPESGLRKWAARLGYLVVGVLLGVVAGPLLLVAAAVAVWLYGMVSEGNSTAPSLPDGAWKMVLALAALFVFALVCYSFAGWVGVLTGSAGAGGLLGGTLGLGRRLSTERKRRLGIDGDATPRLPQW